MFLSKKISPFFLLLSFFVLNKICLAQEAPKGFTITPFFQDITLDKDQTETKTTLEITNNTDSAAVLKFSVMDFGPLNESGGVAFLGSQSEIENKYGLASWISLEKDAVVLNAGETQKINITVENKESLSPGGHYAAVVLKLDNGEIQNNVDSSRVAFDPSFAALIFARKIGGEIYDLQMKGQEIGRNPLGLPGKINLRFQNTGNIYTTPRGLVRLSDPFGREVSRGIINDTSSFILPETFRVFPVMLNKTAWAIFPGMYTVSVDWRYDQRTAFENSSQKIFVITPSFMLILFFALGAGFVSWKIWNKKKTKKEA